MKKMKTPWKAAVRKQSDIASARSRLLVDASHVTYTETGMEGLTCCQNNGQQGAEEDATDYLLPHFRIFDLWEAKSLFLRGLSLRPLPMTSLAAMLTR